MPVERKNRLSFALARWRTWIQVLFTGIWLMPLNMFRYCSPVFHCYACPLSAFACPIGIIAQFSAIHLFPYLAVGTVILAGALFGAFICGYACPFGFFQDLVGKIPTKKFHLPKWTGGMRYVVLIGFVLTVPYFFGEGHPLFICRICPAGALESAIPASVQNALAGQGLSLPNPLKLIILVLVLTAMFVKLRPWCRLFCPLGVIFGLFNRASLIYMKVETDGCNDCTLCRRDCRYGVTPETELQSTRCIRCMECTKFKCGGVTATTILHLESKLKETSNNN